MEEMGKVVTANVGLKERTWVEVLADKNEVESKAFMILSEPIQRKMILNVLERIDAFYMSSMTSRRRLVFLIQNMGFIIEHLLEFPEYLGVSLDKHIVPRCNVIEHLKSIGGLSFDVQFKHFVRLSRVNFFNLYVKPYPKCEKIFGGVVREREVRPRHPPRLWKMFKPKKFPDSKEYVRNMKLFVESLV
ncbi:uncharacterized protein A4U43_UnF10970 [Asparagus officinalis]|uniref:Uncharacterized protein n=1 Tax=Asparagus officinalis TaxID=4686 RepID=A0A1R3L5C7_ASPOF|nr:transcription termination factor MTERF15, mitochondrial-like [Asparagus officinalis]ONK54822.1 uncharacterized protein A4U43_UnF10970 [Asparagus officinalis]